MISATCHLNLKATIGDFQFLETRPAFGQKQPDMPNACIGEAVEPTEPDPITGRVTGITVIREGEIHERLLRKCRSHGPIARLAQVTWEV